MNNFRTLLAACFLSAITATAADDPASSTIFVNFPATKVADHARAGEMRIFLSKQLLAQEKSSDAKALLKDADYRTDLAAHEVLRATGDEALAALLARYSDFKTFLKVFCKDRKWLEAYLSAGSVPTNNPYGLEVLYKIWKVAGNSSDFGKYRELSAALGATWGYSGKRADRLRDALTQKPFNINPVWRYKFFVSKHKAGRLHPMFDDLKSWELRYVVEKPWDDASLMWLNENINIPLQQYVDVFNAVRYRGDNDFGDTIQGPLFYKPWENLVCQAENAKLHGGVCGSLSTFGAVAASAHGIPSYTVGSPSHCAYAVRFARGDWRGAFGGPDGGPHTSAVWEGNIHFVDLMEHVYGDDDGLNLSLTHAARARLLLSAGELEAAKKAIDAAVDASPRHLDIRRDQIEILQKVGKMEPADWQQYAESLLTIYGNHSDPAIKLVQTIEDKFLEDCDDKAKLAWFKQIHAAAARSETLGAWGREFSAQLLQPQFDALESDASREQFLSQCLSAYLDSKDTAFFGTILHWGLKAFNDQGSGNAFFNALSKALDAGAGKLDDEKLRGIFEKAISAACAAKSIPAFQSLAKIGLRFARKEGGPDKLDLPPGKLVSSGGILQLSSQAWCSALNFYNVLNETGGVIHTHEEVNPWVIVELPETVELSGVLVVKNNGNQQRVKKARISRSVDGATWFPIAETPSMPQQWRVNPPANTMARWIKVEALNDKPEFMHFRNILIYSKK